VSFEAAGGTPEPPWQKDLEPGGKITRPQDPAKTGYTFDGWYRWDGTLWDFDTPVTENTTLTAHWIPVVYTVNYNLNGGSGTMIPVSYTIESETITLPEPAKTGYTFAGWYTDSGLAGTAVSAIPQGSTEDRIFWAKWAANTYTVVYNGNNSTGGSTADSIHTYDVPQKLNANGFTRTGYTFAGWAESADGDVVYTNSQSVTNLTAVNGATVTLRAKWTPVNYSITLDEGGFFLSDDWVDTYGMVQKHIDYDSPYGVLPAAQDFISVTPGYNFAGWWTAQTGGSQVTPETIMRRAEDHTIYARWTQTKVSSITLSAETLSLREGLSGKLTATVAPANAVNKTIEWVSGNTAVADVSVNGTVRAVSPGTAVISARATDGSGVSASCAVTVTMAQLISFNVTGNSASIHGWALWPWNPLHPLTPQSTYEEARTTITVSNVQDEVMRPAEGYTVSAATKTEDGGDLYLRVAVRDNSLVLIQYALAWPMTKAGYSTRTCNVVITVSKPGAGSLSRTIPITIIADEQPASGGLVDWWPEVAP